MDRYTHQGLKVDRAYLVTVLIRSLIIEWYVAWWERGNYRVQVYLSFTQLKALK